MRDSKVLYLRVSEELHNRVADCAEADKMKMSAWCVNAIESICEECEEEHREETEQ